MKHKLIMENWRKFQKINESMEKLHALTDQFPNLSDEQLDKVVSIVRSYFDSFWTPSQHSQDEAELVQSLEGEEKDFAEQLIALNREEFGDQAGISHPSGTASQQQASIDRQQRIAQRNATRWK